MSKILIFHHYYGIGGAGTSLIHILHSIVNSSHDITVVCPYGHGDMVNELQKIQNIKVIKTVNTPVIFNHYNGGIKYFFSPHTLVNLVRIQKDKVNVKNIIKENKPDIIIVNSMTLFWIGKIAKQFNIKTICFHRETYKKEIFNISKSIIINGLSRYFDKVAFISKHDLKLSQKISSSKCIIYDRVEDEKFTCYNHDLKEGKTILYLGGFSSLKGAHVLAKSLKHIKTKNVNLLFVHDCKNSLTPYEKKVRKIISSQNSNITVNYLPFIQNPMKYFSMANVLVFPSTLPHQARPIYEAGFSKLPIIISSFKETNEFAINNVNALTFKPKSSIDLANKIDYVFSSRETISKIVENNFKISMQNHRMSTLKKDLFNLINECEK